MGLTETGFKRRTFDEILTAKVERAKELFGDDIDTSELTPLGKYIRINAYDQALTEEEAEMIYNSIFPNTAFGTSLDRLCPFAGITRNPATKAQYTIKITGTAGKIVPFGFLVSTESSINYATLEDAVIGEDGTVEVTVECEEIGEIGNVSPTEINGIVNPSADVESVIGVSRFIGGEEAESDYDLRKRFSATQAGAGACNEDAIKAALLRVPTVYHVGLVINDTLTEDAAGRPAKSVECYVSGGENYHDQIAETIYEKIPMGIKTVGEVSQDILDSGGHTRTINFSHTETVSVYVRMTIKTSAEFEGLTGKEEIKDNLENYIDSIGTGKSVIFSSLYSQIHSVVGVQEVSELLLSTDGIAWSTANITATEYQNCYCKQVEIKANDESSYEVI